jgi:hypothetical protein
MTGSQVRVLFAAPAFPNLLIRLPPAVLGACPRDLSHINIRPPIIVSPSTSRGDFKMRTFILIAGFVLASATAQAGDRSLSLGGGEITSTTAPARAPEGSRIVEAPAEAPKYIERPAAVEPRAETPKVEAPKTVAPRTVAPRTAASRTPRYATRPASAGPGRSSARRTASMSRGAGSYRMHHHGIRARIITALHRHGIYW